MSGACSMHDDITNTCKVFKVALVRIDG
jgi:hypothetical protein